jgi:AraC-like DNA-binding protein
LQAAFRRHTGETPMAWLRELRLERVRQELLSHARAGAAGRQSIVAETAARHGFFHLGHFAAHYRRRYGEPPSSLLRR